eukprot:g7811.t1
MAGYSHGVRAALGEGLAHAMAGRTAAAVSSFELALSQDPACHEAHANLGHLKNVLRQYEDAVRHCDDALRVEPRSVEALSNKGIALTEQAQAQAQAPAASAAEREQAAKLRLQAIGLFDRAVEVDARHWQAHDCLAGVLLQMELERRAGAVEVEVSDAEALLAKARLHAEEALRLVARGRTARPPETLLAKVRALEAVVARPEVLTWAEVADVVRAGGGAGGGAGSGEEGAKGNIARAASLAGQQRFDEAEELLRSTLASLEGGAGTSAAQPPGEAEAEAEGSACWELACLLHFRRGEYDEETLELFGRAAERWEGARAVAGAGEGAGAGAGERVADALANSANAVMAVRKDGARAKDLYMRALDAAPEHAHALISLAALLAQQEADFVGAEALLRRALEAEPDNVFALVNLAILLERDMGRPDGAEELYLKALDACPGQPGVFRSYQAFCQRRGREPKR